MLQLPTCLQNHILTHTQKLETILAKNQLRIHLITFNGLFVNCSQGLQKEVVELRCSLQQSQVEAQYLREELRKAGSQSANPAQLMEEKIKLLREV